MEYNNPYRKGPPSKLLPPIQGLLRVVNINKDIYTVQNLVTLLKCQDVKVNKLRPFTFDPTTQLQFALRDSTDLQEVERITDHKGNPKSRKTQLLFQVFWVGFKEPTWELWRTVRQTDALRDYLITNEDAEVRKLASQLTTELD
jgi:hypothetical protein